MMELLTNFHFLRPYFLLLLPIVGGVWWLWITRTGPLQGWASQIDPDLLAALTLRRGNAEGVFKWNSLAVVLLMVLAIAGPTFRMQPSPFAEDAPPLMILLNADKAMEPDDQETSPLNQAKLKIADLAEARKGQPLGLVVYAGSAHLVLPPTEDTSVVAQMAAEVSPEIMPRPGNRLDLAIQQTREALGDDLNASLLVITNSVSDDPSQIESAKEQLSGMPVQFLAATQEDSSDWNSIQKVARALRAPCRALAVDDADIEAIVRFSESSSIASVTGSDRQWSEAGYWFVPFIVVLIALSFRRKVPRVEGGRS